MKTRLFSESGQAAESSPPPLRAKKTSEGLTEQISGKSQFEVSEGKYQMVLTADRNGMSLYFPVVPDFKDSGKIYTQTWSEVYESTGMKKEDIRRKLAKENVLPRSAYDSFFNRDKKPKKDDGSLLVRTIRG